MRYTQGNLYLNSQERYQIADTSYYLTSGNTIEIFDNKSLKWILGSIEYDFHKGYYFICGKKKIFNLVNALVRVPK